MSQTSPTPDVSAEVSDAARVPRRVGGAAAAAFLVALFNVAMGLSVGMLRCIPDRYTIDDWATWASGALVLVAVVLGGWAAVRGPSRWLGGIALGMGLLQAWWLVNMAFLADCIWADYSALPLVPGS